MFSWWLTSYLDHLQIKGEAMDLTGSQVCAVHQLKSTTKFHHPKSHQLLNKLLQNSRQLPRKKFLFSNQLNNSVSKLVFTFKTFLSASPLCVFLFNFNLRIYCKECNYQDMALFFLGSTGDGITQTTGPLRQVQQHTDDMDEDFEKIFRRRPLEMTLEMSLGAKMKGSVTYHPALQI